MIIAVLSRRFVAAAVVLFAAVCGSLASAALITWDAAASNVDYFAPTQVSTNNRLVDSFTFKPGTDITVNGVTFKHYTGSAGSVASFAGSGITVDLGTGPDQYPGSSNSMGSEVTDYATLVKYAGAVANPVNAVIRLTGLKPGNHYEIQLWVAPWDNPNLVVFSSSADFTTGVSPDLRSTATVYDNKFVSQYIIGTFTADSSTQNIYFQPLTTGWALPAAGQLRVPEPASFTLLGLAGLLALRRRRLGTA